MIIDFGLTAGDYGKHRVGFPASIFERLSRWGIGQPGQVDWIPLKGNVVAATESLILKHNPHWEMADGTGQYPQWLTDLGEAGYREIETFSYDLDVPYSHEDWRGRIRASAGVGASLPSDQVEAFDKELAGLLERSYSDPILKVPHRVFAVVARPPER